MDVLNLIEQDIIEPIRPLLERGMFRFTTSGRIESEQRMVSETPWVHIRQCTWRNCSLWHQVWFNYYNIIPSGCHNCWKVVIRPRTIEELFHIHDILCSLDMPSKCGIEKRYSVNALYGGYLYNDSQEEGLSCLENIRKLLPEGIEAFLKRGCTEFEHKFGDSREWNVTPEQLALERRLDDLFIDTRKKADQGKELRRHVMANWVRFAFANGDQASKKYMEKPLYPPYVTFERDNDI